ncbi:MAG: hypothetical protein F6K22_28440 [Okeania sp. SIO2F4]|uniref:hypothetical protein n=1 Tax=Okeania sp. SIO2F4 TaxID=2607790 RepID=UPI00142B8786|nr:hypothetical protein [Okeania sp. SIO2F4]NES06400.1 hypothetical protein [Okeania sp. SIO2F4]
MPPEMIFDREIFQSPSHLKNHHFHHYSLFQQKSFGVDEIHSDDDDLIPEVDISRLILIDKKSTKFITS